MSRSSCVRTLLTAVVVGVVLALAPAAAQRGTTSADARLRALYTGAR